ncbi:hypothetical protein OSB04_un001048 [Centaurea solstitialis]|uniref:Potassium channel domain-containing protein n=1 Tax=Centaurea solstitialis TaxID=347529 RepID=A0AA38SGU1_9ASTR|nr:hypothetical protein OSB04_un001048 [Centaurea solstitialis]
MNSEIRFGKGKKDSRFLKGSRKGYSNHTAMENNDGNQASPMKLTKPLLVTDEITPIKRKRPRRCKTMPLPKPKTSSFATLDSPSKSISESLIKRPIPKKVTIILSIYLGVGTLCFYRARQQMIKNIITFTSVKHEDFSPGNNLTKLLVSLFAILGMLFVGQVLGKVVDYIDEKQELLLKKELRMNRTNFTAEKLEEIEIDRVKNMCVLLVGLSVVLTAVGIVVLFFVEDLDFTHAIYCVLATTTSLGYSDNCFSTKGGCVFVLFWMVSGTIYFGQLLFTIVVLHTQKRRWKMMKWTLKRKTTIADLEAADLDNNGFIGKDEFILYKLREMGKISHEDITQSWNTLKESK